MGSILFISSFFSVSWYKILFAFKSDSYDDFGRFFLFSIRSLHENLFGMTRLASISVYRFFGIVVVLIDILVDIDVYA